MASVAGPADEIGRRCPRLAAISPWPTSTAASRPSSRAPAMRWTAPVDYFNKLGMTAQLIRYPMPFTARWWRQPRTRSTAPSARWRSPSRASRWWATSTVNSTRPMTWTPSSGAWLTRWRPRSSSSKGVGDLLPRRGAHFRRGWPQARAHGPGRKHSRRQGRRHLLFHKPSQARRGAFLPRSHVRLLRCGHSPPRKSLGCCGSDAARSCRTSRRHAPSKHRSRLLRTEHPDHE